MYGPLSCGVLLLSHPGFIISNLRRQILHLLSPRCECLCCCVTHPAEEGTLTFSRLPGGCADGGGGGTGGSRGLPLDRVPGRAMAYASEQSQQARRREAAGPAEVDEEMGTSNAYQIIPGSSNGSRAGGAAQPHQPMDRLSSLAAGQSVRASATSLMDG